jgi:hypothetical protein
VECYNEDFALHRLDFWVCFLWKELDSLLNFLFSFLQIYQNGTLWISIKESKGVFVKDNIGIGGVVALWARNESAFLEKQFSLSAALEARLRAILGPKFNE